MTHQEVSANEHVHGALESISKAIEKLRGLDGNREQRYLLRLVSSELQQHYQQMQPSPHSSSSPSVAPVTSPSSPAVTQRAPSTDAPQRQESPQRGEAPPAVGPADITTTINRCATVVRGFLSHTLVNNRSNQRILEGALELSQALLNSGLVPVDAQWIPAVIPVPAHVTASMFTKMLGTFRHPPAAEPPSTAPHQDPATLGGPSPSVVPSVAPSSPPSCNPYDEIAMLNLKVALLVPQTAETPGLFTAATSVLTAVVPDRVSRVGARSGTSTSVASPHPSIISSGASIGLSGHSLHQHVYFLLAIGVRACTTPMPTLLSFIKAGISRVVGSVVKELDRHHNLSVLRAYTDSSSPIHRPVSPSSHYRSMSSIGAGRYEPETIALHHDASVLVAIAMYMTSGVIPDTVKEDVGRIVALFPTPPVRTTESRAMCLTAVLQFFVNGGPGLRRSPIILHCIQHTLFPAVLRTALSNEIDVYRLSLNILCTLHNNFYAELVVECGMFFQHVLFQILASHNSSVTQKVLALEVIRQLAEEPKNLLNMYLNYDCDANSTNMYESLLYHLDVLATGNSARHGGEGEGGRASSVSRRVPPIVSTPSPTPPVPQLQRLALETLLCIAEAHRQWIERFVEGGNVEDVGSSDRHIAVNTQGAIEDQWHSSDNPLGDDDVSALVPEPSTFSASTTCGAGNGLDLSHLFGAKKRKRLLERFLRLFNVDKSAERALAFLETEASEILPEDSAPAAHGKELLRRAQSQKVFKGGTALDAALAAGGGADSGSTSPCSNAPQPHEAPTPHDARGQGGAVLADATAELARKVAVLWYSLDGSLDRLVLGDFFAKGYRKEFHQIIFNTWIELHDFRDKAIDVALRQFLGGFKLLGEAQVVDRTMEVFAAHYCRMNPTAFTSANTAFILSFSICMLNTDAHSIHVTEKMSKEAFVRMNRGVDDGKDLEADMLSSIYDRITSEEIKLRPLRAHVRSSTGPDQTSLIPSSDGSSSSGAARKGGNIAVAVLGSIPVLRRLVPIAETIGDAVMIPVDAAGNILFNTAQRKRSQNYSTEFHEVFRDAMALLREHQQLTHTDGAAVGTTPTFVEADSLEHALPMWDLTVEIVVDALLTALQESCNNSSYVNGSTDGHNGPVGSSSGSPPLDPSTNNFSDASSSASESYVEYLVHGVLTTVRVCAALGSLPQAHRMLDRMYHMSTLPEVITLRRAPEGRVGCEVLVSTQRIPAASLRCAVAVLEALAANGSSCTADMWSLGYHIVSYVDALVTFIRESQRKSTDDLSGEVTVASSAATTVERRIFSFLVGAPTASVPDTSKSSIGIKTPQDPSPSLGHTSQSDGALASSEVSRCQQIIDDLHALSQFELWVERLYDATSASSQSLLQMANGLCMVCAEELEVGRVFSLNRLTEFCTVCTSIASRMQWRDLWANSEPIFIAAGAKDAAVALRAVDGLKGIAYHYLLKEELSLYRFQKELLRPFERILMRNNETRVRVAIIRAVQEMIENRSAQLASGWSVLLSLLSHGALIPELVHMSWSGCRQLLWRQLPHLSECFHDLIFCLTSFASNTADAHIAFQGASYLVACGSWLQVGLVPLPQCFEGDEDAEEAAALQGADASTSSASASHCTQPQLDGEDPTADPRGTEEECSASAGGDLDDSSAEGSVVSSASFLSLDNATCAPQQGYDLLQASMDMLDPRQLVEGLEAIDDVEVLRSVCAGGGRSPPWDFVNASSLTPDDWASLVPPRSLFSSPDEELVVIRRSIRAADRLRRDGAQVIPRIEVLCRAPRPPPQAQTASVPPPLDFVGISPSDEDDPPVPNLSSTATALACSTPEGLRTSQLSADVRHPRVVESDAPISLSRLLTRPTDCTLRTEYHLWASLFEGLVPIIFAHCDTRVRLHAVRCLWELVRRFAKFFDRGVQNSLLLPLLRSAVSALATDETLLPQPPKGGGKDAPSAFSQQALSRKYRGILQTSLRGMLYACSTDTHLMTLACDAIHRAAVHARNPRCLKAGLVTVLVSLVADACTPGREAGAHAVLNQSNVSWWITQAHSRVFTEAKGEELLASIVRTQLLSSVMEAWDESVDVGRVGAVTEWLPAMTSARQVWAMCAELAVSKEVDGDTAAAQRWADTLRFAAVRQIEKMNATTSLLTRAAKYEALRRRCSDVALPPELEVLSTVDSMHLLLPASLIAPSLCSYLQHAPPNSNVSAEMFASCRSLVAALLDGVTWSCEVLWGMGPNTSLTQCSLHTLHHHHQQHIKGAAGDADMERHSRQVIQWLATFSYHVHVATINYVLTAAVAHAHTPCGQLFEQQELLALIPRLPSRGDLLWDARGCLCQSVEESILGLEALPYDFVEGDGTTGWRCPHASVVVERAVLLIRRAMAGLDESTSSRSMSTASEMGSTSNH